MRLQGKFDIDHSKHTLWSSSLSATEDELRIQRIAVIENKNDGVKDTNKRDEAIKRESP